MGYFLSASIDLPIVLVWSVCLGFNIAMVISFVLRNTSGVFVSRLFDADALTPENAKTLGELGCNGWLLRRFLKNESTLRKIVFVANDDNVLPTVEKNGKAVSDFETARFYICEDGLEKANLLKKGKLGWWVLPLFSILSIILAAVIDWLMPIFTNL